MVLATLLLTALSALAIPAPAPAPAPGPNAAGGLAVAALDERAGGNINNINVTVTPTTPDSIEQCARASVEFDGGVAPYLLKIGTGGYYVPDSKWLYAFPAAESPFEWVVNASVGTSLNFQVFDATGQTKNVQNLVVKAGESSACLRCGAKPAPKPTPVAEA